MSTSTEQFAEALKLGKSKAELIGEMKDRGLSIIEAIKAVREVFGVGLGEAKQLVANHPAYVEIARAADPLHEELIQVFEDAVRQENEAPKGPK